MNPITNVKNLNKLNALELSLGTAEKTERSWHQKYKDSAWIFVGGLPYELSEGDVVCVFSQYGEIVHINLVRDRNTGKSRGFCFLCYEDQRSTVLAVDNFNGIKLLGRIIRVDHVQKYRVPKIRGDEDESTLKTLLNGIAPTVQKKTSPDVESERKKKERTKRGVKRERSLSPLLPLDPSQIIKRREAPLPPDPAKLAEMERAAAVLNPGTELTVEQLNERIEALANKSWPMFDRTKLKDEETFLPTRYRRN
uniref:RRM domain-containing protein n=1 Tax=Trichuris muris TaxID=70415 RepID=A0A5S6Q5L3_TRIMR